MTEKTARAPSWLLPIGLAVLVIGLVVIALTRGPSTFDPDTPEAAVQEYLQALSDERWDDAVDVIHPEWLGSCSAGDIASFAPSEFTAQLGTAGTSFGGNFIEERFTEIGPGGEDQPLPTNPDEFLDVTITRDGGGGLGAGWDEYVRFELLDEDGFWWIINDPWPYFVWNCREF